jgi:hypothetical protein
MSSSGIKKGWDVSALGILQPTMLKSNQFFLRKCCGANKITP